MGLKFLYASLCVLLVSKPVFAHRVARRPIGATLIDSSPAGLANATDVNLKDQVGGGTHRRRRTRRQLICKDSYVPGYLETDNPRFKCRKLTVTGSWAWRDNIASGARGTSINISVGIDVHYDHKLATDFKYSAKQSFSHGFMFAKIKMSAKQSLEIASVTDLTNIYNSGSTREDHFTDAKGTNLWQWVWSFHREGIGATDVKTMVVQCNYKPLCVPAGNSDNNDDPERNYQVCLPGYGATPVPTRVPIRGGMYR